jgi:hypothetical protein
MSFLSSIAFQETGLAVQTSICEEALLGQPSYSLERSWCPCTPSMVCVVARVQGPLRTDLH